MLLCGLKGATFGLKSSRRHKSACFALFSFFHRFVLIFAALHRASAWPMITLMTLRENMTVMMTTLKPTSVRRRGRVPVRWRRGLRTHQLLSGREVSTTTTLQCIHSIQRTRRRATAPRRLHSQNSSACRVEAVTARSRRRPRRLAQAKVRVGDDAQCADD